MIGIVIVIIILAILWLALSKGDSTYSNSGQQQFNSNLVNAKLDCQKSVDSWKLEHSKSGDVVVQQHFNASLSACLIEILSNSPEIMHNQSNIVMDIYDSKVLLELDIELPGSTASVGEYLYDNGKQVRTSDAQMEYQKRRAALFENAS
jgi:hypothetical protein